MTQEPVVRDYRPEDEDEVKRLHDQMGMDYQCPDLSDKLFVVKKVLEAGGQLVGVVLARIELETILLLEQSLSPAEKNAAMHVLQPPFLADCRKLGVESCVCWIPENVETVFKKRLLLLGWTRDRDGWRTWSRSTSEDK